MLRKEVSDMDEYIRRVDALKATTYVGTAELSDIIPLTLLAAQKNIRKIPTADVVPKSHYDCLLSLNSRLEKEMGRKEEKIQELIKQIDNVEVETALEVAREIFEEVELFLNKAIDGWKKERRFCYHNRDIEMIDFRNDAFKYCLNKIAELKKKYTEEHG